MMSFLRTYTPTWLMRFYHLLWAIGSDVLYGRPTKNMVVIGVTGTKGKSTSAILMHHLLSEAGYTAGLLSSVVYKVGVEKHPSVSKMSMPGRGALQKWLRKMQRAGCTHVVVEVTSEGILQYRHRGIRFDVVVLTNLTPEHIERHGSFEAYRDTKAELFSYASSLPEKRPDGSITAPRVRILPKGILTADDLVSFMRPVFPVHAWYGIDVSSDDSEGRVLVATDMEETAQGVRFHLVEEDVSEVVRMQVPGRFHVLNALAAVSACRAIGAQLNVLAQGLQSFPGAPGRMQTVVWEPFRVIVDYAHEPASYTAALTAARSMIDRTVYTEGRVLAVIGATGGGRDMERRPELGKIAAELADVVMVTNEDPYDEDPEQIIAQVYAGVVASGRLVKGQTALHVQDRREAIEWIIGMAKPGDVVILLGKGHERAMVVADGKQQAWSDIEVVQELVQ